MVEDTSPRSTPRMKNRSNSPPYLPISFDEEDDDDDGEKNGEDASEKESSSKEGKDKNGGDDENENDNKDGYASREDTSKESGSLVKKIPLP